MKKLLVSVLLLGGLAGGLRAQDASASATRTNAAVDFADSSASQVTLYTPSEIANFSVANSEAAPASSAPAALPSAPEPQPQPKYVFFGDRDDYRWQLGVGFEYLRFNSSAFDANMLGVNTTLTYYTNTWFAVEGSVVTGFGPQIYGEYHAKFFGGAGGIRIGGRRARWEPFGHALVGGSHLQEQTAEGSRNALMAQAGVGVDFRVHSRLSLRGEGDWIYTTYFSQNQNNFQVVAGIVLHF
jgi:opacity protein-like surface antigen